MVACAKLVKGAMHAPIEVVTYRQRLRYYMKASCVYVAVIRLLVTTINCCHFGAVILSYGGVDIGLIFSSDAAALSPNLPISAMAILSGLSFSITFTSSCRATKTMIVVMLLSGNMEVDTNKYSSDPELKLILSHSLIQVNVHRLLASSPPSWHDSVSNAGS